MKYKILILLLTISFAATHAQDKTSLRQAKYNLSGKKIAMDGYDPVSYFSVKPQKGNSNFATSYQGITYYFISAQNKEEFQKNPTQYEPKYGGWCAYAMGKDGSKVEVDPETYKIVSGRLYLFYNNFFNNTLKIWNTKEGALMKSADVNWTKYYH